MPRFFCVFFFLFSFFPLFPKSIDSLILQFTRDTVAAAADEHLSGTLYYRRNPHLFSVYCDETVRQIIRVSAGETLIYYPDSALAFRVVQAASFRDSFEREVLSLFTPDKGLESLGYRMDSIRVSGAGLECRWLPPEADSRFVKDCVVFVNSEEQVVSMKTCNLDDAVLATTVFGEYRPLDGAWYPESVCSEFFSPSGELLSSMVLSITSARINEALPEAVDSFVLPDGVEIRAMQ